MSDFNAEAQRRRGWEVRRLKTLASCNDEVLPESTSDFARIEYIEISDVDESRGIFNSTFHVFKDAPSRARRIARKGDVIISTVRTYLKAIATIEREGLVVSTGFAVLRARTSVLPRFLAYAVKSAVFKDNVVRYSTGTSYPAINASDLMCLSIPLPPISEQKAIVAYLDAETGRIDKAIAAEERMIALLQERREIVINEAVGGGMDFNAETQRRRGWEERRLKSLLKKPLQYGANEAAEESDNSQPRYIRITDIDDSGKLREETFRSLPMEKAKPYLLEKGDLLFARSGATAGKSFLFKEDYAACFAGYLIRASLTSAITPEYLFYFTQSGEYRQWKEAVFIQATIQNISAEKYGNLPIPLPPLPEQEEIVKRLDAETGKIDRAIEVKRRQIELLRERRQIVIDEAVRGEPRRREPLQKLTRATAKPGAADAAPYKTKGGA